MAEKSYWWTTGGAGDGASTYTRDDLAAVARILAACANYQGVAPGYLNQLSGSVPSANTVRINTGGAVVDGKPYYNNSTVDITIPSAVGTGNTRIDRIVLRADWTAQTVRIYRIAGTDAASPNAPAITQTSGSVYDIKLYQALVNTSGTVTLTDERDMAVPQVDASTVIIDSNKKLAVGAIGISNISDNAITNAKMRDSAATSVIGRASGSSGDPADIAATADGQVLKRASGALTFAAIDASDLADGIISTTKIADSAVSSAKIGTGAVGSTQLADNSVTTSKIADSNVTAAKIANGAVGTTQLADSAVTTVKISDANVTADKIASSAITETKIADNAVTTNKIADSNVTTGKIADLNVTTAKIANDAVDDTKVGNRVPQFYRRQGGSATDWSYPGTSNYTPTAVRMQAGAVQVTIPNGSYYADTTVTFPQAFSQIPIVTISFSDANGATIPNPYDNNNNVIPTVINASSTQFTIRVMKQASTTGHTYTLNWFAVGAE
jgi:hypothetical protein